MFNTAKINFIKTILLVRTVLKQIKSISRKSFPFEHICCVFNQIFYLKNVLFITLHTLSISLRSTTLSRNICLVKNRVINASCHPARQSLATFLTKRKKRPPNNCK